MKDIIDLNLKGSDDEKIFKILEKHLTKEEVIDKQTHIDKFKEYRKACEYTGAIFIIIDHLGVIGDTIKELDNNIKYALDHNKEIVVVNGDYRINRK